MVLGSYEGERHKRVAETLLQLAEAQVHSVCQQSNHVSEEQILTISIRKGSLSVLADYLFAASDWREEEELFYLKFGFLLQLVDDLQDIREDREHGSRTLMTQAGEKRRLERYVNRLLWYSWNVICGFEPRNPGLKGFILKNCVAIILLAAARSYPFFSAEYLKGIEPYLPFSLRFMKKGKSQNRH